MNVPDTKERKNSPSRSSTSSGSIYSETALPTGWNTATPNEYSVQYSKLHSNLTFGVRSPTTTDPSNIQPIFYSRTSILRPGVPDVTLHDVRGRDVEDKTAPVLGVARFRWKHGSRSTTLGLGDPENDPNGVTWEDMKNASLPLKHDKYRFEFAPRDTSFTFSNNFTNEISSTSAAPSGGARAPSGARKSYTWNRTYASADGVEGWGRWSLSNYKLIDDATGDVIAVFLSNGAKGWRSAGKLRFVPGRAIDDDLLTLIVLSCASITEKMRRRKQGASASSGGHGG